jgi:hypothetical protein
LCSNPTYNGGPFWVSAMIQLNYPELDGTFMRVLKTYKISNPCY